MTGLPNLPGDQADQDAARRLSDAVALHLVADFERAIRCVVVVKLEDGSTDGVLYESWDDACRIMERYKDARFYAPVRVTPDGITERDALRLLRALRAFPGVKAVPEGMLQRSVFKPGGERLN